MSTLNITTLAKWGITDKPNLAAACLAVKKPAHVAIFFKQLEFPRQCQLAHYLPPHFLAELLSLLPTMQAGQICEKLECTLVAKTVLALSPSQFKVISEHFTPSLKAYCENIRLSQEKGQNSFSLTYSYLQCLNVLLNALGQLMVSTPQGK